MILGMLTGRGESVMKPSAFVIVVLLSARVTAQQAALAEQTLNAIQSGSFCRTAPALPEVRIVRAGGTAKPRSNVTTGMKRVRAP